jgi:hypothetical protein
MDNAELSRITAPGGTRIGTEVTNNITVMNVGNNIANLRGIVTLISKHPGGHIRFIGETPAFDKLVIQADNGLELDGDLTSLIDELHIDADMDSTAESYAVDNGMPQKLITITADKKLESKTHISLFASTNAIVADGALTLKAATGIHIDSSLDCNGAAKVITIHADDDSNGSGVFTLSSTKHIVTNQADSPVRITAADVDLQGSLHTTSTLNLHESKAGLTFGFGRSSTHSQQFVISDDELQRTTATGGLRLGGHTSGSMQVDGITRVASENITPMVSLVAKADGSTMTFQSMSSTFYALEAQADNGMILNKQLTTTHNNLFLDADMDNTANDTSTVTSDVMQIASDITLAAKTNMVLESTSGHINRLGALTLQAETGIEIRNNLNSLAANKTLVLYPDYLTDGDGTLTVTASATIDSNDGTVIITAFDVDLSGSLTAGANKLYVQNRVPQSTSIGSPTKDMQITDAELQRITATTGLHVGTTSLGSIWLGDLQESSTDMIATLTLIATAPAQTVTFEGGDSTFNKGIVIQADGGVNMQGSVITKSQITHIYAGTGTLTVAAGKKTELIGSEPLASSG